MEIYLNDIGRRFNYEWIFRHLTFSFETNRAYAILGPNGSGKSTLLQVLSGSLSPSEGKISYQLDGEDIGLDIVYRYIAIAAPYLELIEEFTLEECLHFHFKLKELHPAVKLGELQDLLGLSVASGKEIRYYSSGMKQRLKLILACCSNTPILLLDEPTSNLDAQGVSWYQNLIDRFSKDRVVIIGSNQPHEYAFCSVNISVPEYKLKTTRGVRGAGSIE